MLEELNVKIMDYVTEYVYTFSDEYNELNKSLTKKICRLELYVPLPSDLLGVDISDEFACLVRLKTCQDKKNAVLLLHNGRIVKPTKSMGALIDHIVNGGTVEYINDWGNVFI